jgi:hypothetical protein
MSETNEASVESIVMRLRTQGAGKPVWRVQDKDDKSYSIEFESWQQIEAMQWWADNKHRDIYKNSELAKVLVHSSKDRLMQEAADMLDFLFGEMQIHSAKMDGRYLYRFRTGWPMNHLIGTRPEDAVRAAMREVQEQTGLTLASPSRKERDKHE